MLRCAVPVVLLLLFAVGAGRLGGVATLHVQISGSGSVTSNPPGIRCAPECSEPFDSGTRVTLTAQPSPNESFLGWGGACTGTSATCSVVADVEKTIGAKFTPGTLPALTIDDASTFETNVDTVAVLTATLAPASAETVRVHYATADGTADATDYVHDSGTLTFPPGTTSVRIPVLIKADALDEPDETLFVDLSAPEHATIGRARGTITIIDADPPPLRLVDAIVTAKWQVGRGYTRVRRLVVTHASAGAVVDVRCAGKGKGCPFRHRTTGYELTRLFANTKLRPGATITVEISSPGRIGRVFEYRIRAGKVPRARLLCVPGTTPPVC